MKGGIEIMDKTLHDIINQSYDTASKSLAAIKAYGEYCESFSSKLSRFLESDQVTDKISVVIKDQLDPLISHVGLITAQDYSKALEDEEAVLSIAISDSEELFSVTGAEIVEAVHNNLSEILVQGEFIKGVFDSTVDKAGDLFTLIRAKYKDISSSIIDKYSSLWDSSNPMMSIKNFLQQRSEISIQQNANGTISLYDPRGYAGGSVDVWATAFSSVFDKIGSFFDHVWQGLQDLQGFFERLWNGLVNVFKWLVSKAFSQLFTNYEKAGSHYGLIDVPLLQTYLGKCYYGSENHIPDEAYNALYLFKLKYHEDYPSQKSFNRIILNNYRYSLYDYRNNRGDVSHTLFSSDNSALGHNYTQSTLYHNDEGYFYVRKKCLSLFLNTRISTDGENSLDGYALALVAFFTYEDSYKGAEGVDRSNLPLLYVDLVYCAICVNSNHQLTAIIPLDEYASYKAYISANVSSVHLSPIDYLLVGCYEQDKINFMNNSYQLSLNGRKQYDSAEDRNLLDFELDEEPTTLNDSSYISDQADLDNPVILRPIYWSDMYCYAMTFLASNTAGNVYKHGFITQRLGNISNNFRGKLGFKRGVTSPYAPLLTSNDSDDYKCFNYDPCWLDTLLAYKHSDNHSLPAPDGRTNGYLIQWNCADNFDFYFDESDDAILASIGINLRSICNHLIYDIHDEDPGSLVSRTLDIVVPTSTMPQLLSIVSSYSKIPYAPHDCLVRFGLKQIDQRRYSDGKYHSKSYALIMQVFALSSWDEVSSVTDDVNACRLHDTAYALAAYMADNYHCIPYTHFHVRFDNAFTIQNACYDFALKAVDISTIDRDSDPTTATFDLVSHMHLIDQISISNYRVINSRWTRDESSDYASGNLYACLILAILAYSALQGPGYLNDYNETVFDEDIHIYTHINEYLTIGVSRIIPLANLSRTDESTGIHFTWNEYTVSSAYGDYITKVMADEEAVTVLNTNLATFTPYLMYSPYNVSVHYQSNIERAQEAEQIIWAVVIAVIGVTIAIAARHFIRKRQIKMEIARGHMESLSWTAGDSPTKENIKAYTKARRKLRRISRLNSLLGIGEYDSDTSVMYSTLEGVVNQVNSIRGCNSEDGAPTIQDVYSSITGLK